MTEPTIDELIDKYSASCTDRQRVILQLTRQGLSSRRIALHVGCSHSTVLMELDRATTTVIAKKNEAEWNDLLGQLNLGA